MVVTVVEVAVVGSVLKLSLEVFLNANLVLILIFLLVEFMAFFAKNILKLALKHFYYSKYCKHYMNPQYRLNGIFKVHLICWLVFIAYEVLVAGMISGQYANVVYYISFYGLNISLFYLHAHIVLPKSFAQGKRRFGVCLFFSP